MKKHYRRIVYGVLLGIWAIIMVSIGFYQSPSVKLNHKFVQLEGDWDKCVRLNNDLCNLLEKNGIKCVNATTSNIDYLP